MLITRFIFETQTALHCGGSDDPIQDQPVVRDAFGNYFIQATSIAGILRAYLAENYGECTAKKFFGDQNKDSNNASLIWCSDAILLDYDEKPASWKILQGEDVKINQGPFVRDHVKLDLDSGCAEKGGKFDEEIVPIGARFAVEVSLDGYERELKQEEKEIFLQICSAFASGEIRIGGGIVNGYGRIKATYAKYCEFDLHNSEEDLTAWLNLQKEPKFADKALNLPEKKKNVDKKKHISANIEAILESCGPILVGGVNNYEKDLDSDIVCLRTPKFDYLAKNLTFFYTLPGSSFRGALRHRVYNIAQAIDLNTKPEKRVDAIFGTTTDQTAQIGKVAIEDVLLDIKESKQVQHVAIDRFTGGAVDGALFDEKPIWKNKLNFSLRLEIKDLALEDAKLLLHALLDLATSKLPLGSGTNRGNGRLQLKDIAQGWSCASKNLKMEVSYAGELVNLSDPSIAKSFLQKLEGK